VVAVQTRKTTRLQIRRKAFSVIRNCGFCVNPHLSAIDFVRHRYEQLNTADDNRRAKSNAKFEVYTDVFSAHVVHALPVNRTKSGKRDWRIERNQSLLPASSASIARANKEVNHKRDEKRKK
jgi:membrane carboxypeptidase/penicillin-binding protein